MTAPHPSTSETGPQQKAVLHCAVCGHESGVDGDWNTCEENDRLIYECPVCSTTITERCRIGSTNPLPSP